MGNRQAKDLSGSNKKGDVKEIEKIKKDLEPSEPTQLEAVPIRKWLKVNEDGDEGGDSDFVLCTHNILAPRYTHTSKYPFCPKEYLDQDYRNRKLIQQVKNFQPLDIICLQELQGNILDELLPSLSEDNYSHHFKRITKHDCWKHKPGEDEKKASENEFSKAMFHQKEGVGIFWKDETFELLQKYEFEFNRLNFEEITNKTKNSLTQAEFINNTFFNWRNWSGQVHQIDTLLRKIREIEDHYDELIVCGDFNSQPHGKTFEFMTCGELQNFDETEFHGDPEKEGEKELGGEKEKNNVRIYKWLEREPKHEFKFRNSYPEDSKPVTAFSPRAKKGMVIDYIFYDTTSNIGESSSSLKPLEVLEVPEEEYVKNEFPNPRVYSDHVMLATKFSFCCPKKEEEEEEEEEGEEDEKEEEAEEVVKKEEPVQEKQKEQEQEEEVKGEETNE